MLRFARGSENGSLWAGMRMLLSCADAVYTHVQLAHRRAVAEPLQGRQRLPSSGNHREPKATNAPRRWALGGYCASLDG
jgi:hypothetical protein